MTKPILPVILLAPCSIACQKDRNGAMPLPAPTMIICLSAGWVGNWNVTHLQTNPNHYTKPPLSPDCHVTLPVRAPRVCSMYSLSDKHMNRWSLPETIEPVRAETESLDWRLCYKTQRQVCGDMTIENLRSATKRMHWESIDYRRSNSWACSTWRGEDNPFDF